MFSNSIKKVTVSGMALSLILVALNAPSAKAVVADSNVYSQYQSVRVNLLNKEQRLQKDFDALQKTIDDLRKANDKNLDKTIDDLSRSLDNTYLKLRNVRLDIKDLDGRML
ncbi:MAG: hypothetical protein K2X77_20150 [Candidatus Obscuribacterales bacterium]|jgi:peptidoglycan hydrolase CwlO-like protein|nr:hypothetical protein [Candidatus Obscuribacterales bacterium]